MVSSQDNLQDIIIRAISLINGQDMHDWHEIAHFILQNEREHYTMEDVCSIVRDNMGDQIDAMLDELSMHCTEGYPEHVIHVIEVIKHAYRPYSDHRYLQ